MIKPIFPMTSKKIMEATVEELTLKQVIEVCALLMTGVSAAKDQLKTQSSKGIWDYDPYMHGMANGMILAVATITGEDPNFLDAPEKWGRNFPIDAPEEYARYVQDAHLAHQISASVKVRIEDFHDKMSSLNHFVQNVKRTLQGED